MRLMRQTLPLALTFAALFACSSKHVETKGSPPAEPQTEVESTPPPAVIGALPAIDPATSSPGPIPEEHGNIVQAPFTMTLSGPPSVGAGDVIVLTVTIDVAVAIGAALTMTTTLPEGVTLVDGAAVETLGPQPVGRVQRTLRLRVARVPATDLVVTVSYRTEGSGATAKKVYSFGRSALLPRPLPRNRAIKAMGGRTLGAPIPLTRVGTRPSKIAAP
jgi:hypothetical protein